MSKKQSAVLGLLLCLCLLMLGLSHLRIMDIRSDIKHKQQISSIFMPDEMLMALAGEFKGVVADYFFLEASSFVGGNLKTIDQNAWDKVARLLDQSNILDPYFKQTYSFAQGVLPWYAENYDMTLSILERSKNHAFWDWLPGFYIGFDHFYFLRDNVAASKALMEAAKKPDAPEAIAVWASRLASQTGRFQAAIEFLQAMYNNTEEESQKKAIELRMAAVRGAYQLQLAVDQFQKRFGRLPITLDELVDNGIIKQLPKHPYGDSYFIKDGRVEF